MDKDLHMIKKLLAVAWLLGLCAMAQTAADVPSAAGHDDVQHVLAKIIGFDG